MSDFSNQKSKFENIELKNVVTLVSVLLDADIDMKAVIKRRFSDEATNFEETVSFMETIGGVQTDDKGIWLNDSFAKLVRTAERDQLKRPILDLIHKRKNPFQSEILHYIRRFNHNDGIIAYKPIEFKLGEHSAVRNFLMEIDVIKYDYDNEIYTILPEHIHLFAQANEMPSSVSLKVLRRRLADKDKVGAAAELEILKYEKDRVGPKFSKSIEHISKINEAAGYDIKSVTITIDAPEPRYIEVKAVPADSYRFFWSFNEIRVAELLNINYHLYLLPVKQKMKFALDDMKIISNPVPVIFDDADTWNVKTDTVCCSLNKAR